MSGKVREFIACKRVKSSSWQYDEYSEEIDKAFDQIAPNSGNFCKIRLIAKEDLQPFVDDIKKYCCGQDKCQKRGTLCGSLTRFLKAWEGV